MATNITTVIKAAVVLFALSGLIYASFIYENKYIYFNPTVSVTADILSCVLDTGIMLSNTSTKQQLSQPFDNKHGDNGDCNNAPVKKEAAATAGLWMFKISY